MITLVALKTRNKLYIGLPGQRHDSVILKAISEGEKTGFDNSVQGFMTDKGVFLDRHAAAKHAFLCGQITEWKEGDIIMSEELW